MKTTIEIADSLFNEVRSAAQKDGMTFRAIVEAGLRRELTDRKFGKAFRLRDGSVKGNGIRPELEGAPWEKIRELAYEGHGG